MVSKGCCGGDLPDTVCWKRLRNTWIYDGARNHYTKIREIFLLGSEKST